MLCQDGFSSRVLFHALKDEFAFAAIIVEDPVPLGRLLRRRVKVLGALTVAGQVAFMVFAKLAGRLGRHRRRVAHLLERFGISDAPLPSSLVRRVNSVNGPDTLRVIKAAAPSVMLVNGTRIIGKTVLEAVAVPFINTHAGITPAYRGVHGGYWALASGDPDHCGVTVHLVDPGIDTGGVLYQARIAPDPSDWFLTYPIHQTAAAIPLMRQALADARDGRLTTTKPDLPSRLWSHPTLWTYLRLWSRRGVR